MTEQQARETEFLRQIADEAAQSGTEFSKGRATGIRETLSTLLAREGEREETDDDLPKLADMGDAIEWKRRSDKMHRRAQIAEGLYQQRDRDREVEKRVDHIYRNRMHDKLAEYGVPVQCDKSKTGYYSPWGILLTLVHKLPSIIADARASALAPLISAGLCHADGTARTVLGRLPLTADGCIVGDEAELWLPPRGDDPNPRRRGNGCAHFGRMYSTQAAALAARKASDDMEAHMRPQIDALKKLLPESGQKEKGDAR